MNKYIKKMIQSKASKRIISGLTAFVMLSGALPVNDMSNIGDFFAGFGYFSLLPLIASAADPSEDDDPTFQHDPVTFEITVKNSEFADYSRSCQIYAKYHQQDKITITDLDDTSISDAINFAGLGTAAYPFAGSIAFDGNTDITLNLDGPLFNYVYDTVTIENNGNPLKLSRYYYRGSNASDTTPLLAQNVLPGTGTKAAWNISIMKPTNSDDYYLKPFGGLIGRMHKDNNSGAASLSINVTMNADGSDNGTVEIKGNTDIGLICGYMEEGTSLAASFSTDRGGGNGISSISTSSGNAGGLVGTMERGTALTCSGNQYQADGEGIKTADGYAGGMAGKNEGGTINLEASRTISQHIEGTLGSGSIYGYYKPAENVRLAVTDYTITNGCQVNGSGSIGGLFGVLENNYDMAIEGAENGTSFTATHAGGAADAFGGLIGTYRSDNLANSLVIKNLSVTPSRGTSTFYGGGIAVIDDTVSSSYVKFENFTVTNAAGANGMTFGGLVAKADNSFVEASNTTISVSGNFRGGAAVGSLENGVLKLSGKFDISGAAPGSPNDDYREGKIVGYRNNALIYADNWTYSGNNAEVDNIGSWGDIIVFDDTKLKKADVLTEKTDHTITITEPGESININSVADYAKTSLAFQIDSRDNKVLTNDKAAKNSGDITFGSDQTAVTIDLTGTGLRGITRDNTENDRIPEESDNADYTGTITGNNATIILDFENVGGLPVCRHKYNGMFAFVHNTTVKNLKFEGKLNLNAVQANVRMFGASFTSEAYGTFNAENVEVNTVFTTEGSKEVCVGGLLGWGASSIGDITVSDSTFYCNITDNNSNKDSCFGGVIGRINHYNNTSIEWDFTELNITGSIKSSTGSPSRIGGLIASIDQHTGVTQRSLNLTGVNVKDLTLTGAGTSMGGLLGYSWLNVNATFHNVTVNNSKISDSINNVNLAGLVYLGTGHWVAEKENGNPGISINGITIEAANASSFGMIVNKGKNNDDTAIFLEIKDGAYVIQNSNLDNLKTNCVFDEIVAYSASDVCANGQGVVSINVGGTDGGLTMDGTGGSNTYNAQTERGKIANRNTRYYYNLDTIREKTNPSNAEKLLLWALNRYAHSSINTYFSTEAGWNYKVEENWKENIIPDGIYDMKGYSWYPVDVGNTVTVNGTFKFYNSEFESSENAKSSTNHFTSLGDKNSYTQHHLMQNGLFCDVTGTLNVGTVRFSGSIGTDDYGSGALVWGTVKGSSASNIASVIMVENGSITLDGIFVHDLASYNPLLINQIGSYSTVSLSDVSNTKVYKTIDGINKPDGYPKAATSLIGKAGKSDATNINIGFEKIKLDGRTAHTNTSLDTVYNTECSLFTRATLLEHFQYDSGASGIYNYSYDEDWGADGETTPPRNVTYGYEISDPDSEYYGQEFWYNNEDHENGRYTIYDSGLTPKNGNAETYKNQTAFNYNNFLPYVAVKDPSNKQHQLSVNHAAAGLSGCGTYNDPYQIPNAAVLTKIVELLNGTNSSDFIINLPTLKTDETLQFKSWDTDRHLEYKWDSTNSYYVDSENSKTYNQDDIRKYVAGAYFEITGSFELPQNYKGLGNTPSNEESVFRGVIVGNNNTITLKGSNPFIFSSYGSVVKDLTIKVDSDIVMSNQNQGITFVYDKEYSNTKTYGAVMGRVLGGDNIIDNVSVNFQDKKIKLRTTGTNKQNRLLPVGGYVGVAVKGTLIFRNMDSVPEDDRMGLKSDTVVDYNKQDNPVNTNLVNDDGWLYVNPIIGRVINAAVFTESNKYRPFEDGTRKYYDKNGNEQTYKWPDGAVTMKNGTKDYSIPDIDKNGGSFTLTGAVSVKGDIRTDYKNYSKLTMEFPNAQSLFLMSEITQTGMSESTYGYRKTDTQYCGDTDAKIGDIKPVGGFYESDHWGVASYQTYRSVHNAEYDRVGRDPAGTEEPNSTSDTYTDYELSKADGYWGIEDGSAIKRKNLVPYIVRKYTPKISESKGIDGETLLGEGYIAFVMTHQYNYLYMKFTDTAKVGTYYLPDGFRGIGMLGHKNVFVGTNFDGEYRDMIPHIFGIEGNYVTVSLNMKLHMYNSEDSYAVTDKTYMGFGFFDSMIQNKDGSANSIDLTKEEYQIKDFTITGSVYLDAIDMSTGKIPAYTESMDSNRYYTVGGLTGSTPGTSEIYQLNLVNVTPSNLNVTGVRYTGGLIGYNVSKNEKKSKTTITHIKPKKLKVSSGIYAGGLIGYSTQTALDINDVTIEEPDIISTYTGSVNSYKNAVGGIVGYVDTNTKSYGVELKNITIGNIDADKSTSFGYENQTTQEVTVVGGLIGKNYTYSSLRISDGSITHSTKIEDCNIYNVNLNGHRVGGVIGSSENNNSTTSVAIYNTHVISTLGSSIKGVSNTKNNGRGCAGFIGYFRTSKDDNVIDGCSLEGYNLYSALETGAVSGNTEGGTINIRNFKVSDTNIHSSKRVGGLYGWNKTSILGYNILMNNVLFYNYDSDEVPTTECGYLCGNFNDGGRRVKIAGFSRKGTINCEKMLGNKSSDYDFSTDGYVIFSDYEGLCLTNSKSQVFSDINGENNVTDYNGNIVTDNSPYITSSPKRLISTSQFLTGDGVSAVSFAQTPFMKIITDRVNDVAGAYKTSTELTDEQIAAIKNQFTHSLEEFDASTGVDHDFPLLIVNDTDPTATTDLINNYLGTLTNTKYNFADNTKNAIYAVALNTCIFNTETGKFNIIKDKDANLYHSTVGNNQHCFRMDANSVDNGHDYAQFTLLDVQFKDPADTSKVAYHLYVPVIVKKLLQFEFNASIESGTSYYPDAYSTKKTLFENLGNPATIKFEYTYDRDADGWIKAINEGETMSGNLNKALALTYSGGKWPDDTRLVLVDASNKDKFYYLDNPTQTASLPLSSFKDEKDKGYVPVPLNDLMQITITPDSNGTLMLNNDENGNNKAANATVKDKNGIYYRYITSDDTPSQKYMATNVTDIHPERYYLSIFTKKNDNDGSIYHIALSSLDKFNENQELTGWRPNKVISNKNQPVHLVTGMLYETNYKLTASSATTSQIMSSTNSHLDVNMSSTISLTENAVNNGVPGNMKSAGSSTIYQTFLMTYDTIKTKGESSVIGLNENAYPYTNVLSYKIYKGKTATETELYKDILGETNGYTPAISGTNFIDLWNKQNLISLLRESSNGYSVTLRTNFWVGYEPDALGYQFPKKNSGESDVEIGAKVIGYSNISSALASLNYSESTWRAEGDKRYYTEDDSSATLTYNADTTPGSSSGLYSSLGINSVELGDTTSHISSTAVYDISALKSSGEYVEFNISLSSRKAGYENKLKIDQYIESMEIKGISEDPLLKLDHGTLTTTNDSNIKVTENANGTEYTLRVKKNLLPTLGQDKVYTVRLTYDIYTGNTKFNQTGLAYSNYMLTLNAALYDSMNSENFSPSSNSSDHIIYTNARVQSKVMD